MTEEQITAKVEAIIRAELLLEDDEEITPGTDLVKDLGVDSLDLVEIEMALQTEFDFQMPEDDTTLWQPEVKVSAIVDYVAGKIG